MNKKAAISFPLAFLVSLIAVAIIIGVFVFFLWVTKGKIETAFGDAVNSIKEAIKKLLGPLGALIG